ncbi:auxin efflux carrier [Tanacetum coccineum]|uniref:Auxin efflux carrier n=1 Tax=Tanacetum coccineum TaxID=301880 RepID=A0ABQ5HRJ7_9ASTR
MESVGILLCALVFRHWDWTSNGALCAKGTRIILGWNHNDVDVMVLTQDDQAIHTRVWLKAEKKEVFCSFIYAHNHYTERLLLWKGLSLHKLYVHDRPWCLMGDFNASLSMEDISAGSSKIDISMREFKAFVDDIEVMDVNKSGLLFTWNQKPKGVNGILKKLDRMMANLEFNDAFVGAHAIFMPYRISNHSHLKAKIQWLKEGDSNSAYFHKFVKSCTSRSRIYAVTNAEGIVCENEMVADAFVSHYEAFLGQADVTNGFNTNNLFKTCLGEHVALDMVRDISRQEVKEAVFSMSDDKSLGPNGYTAVFFKEAWDIVANDVTDAVCEFFKNDDLFLFAHGDVQAACVIKDALEEFKFASGLTLSLPKSTAYFCIVLNYIKIAILQIFPFEEGILPVKYLGVRLVSSRLMIRDCKELVERVQNRIQDWKNKSLSIAAMVIRGRLKPKSLGRLYVFLNMRVVKWIHEYKLKGHSFLDIPLRGNMAWGWRKMLQLRPTIHEFIWSKIGDGSRTSLWIDPSKVNDVIFNGVWNWPTDLIGKYPILSVVSGTNAVEGVCDKVWTWRTFWWCGYDFHGLVQFGRYYPSDTKVVWNHMKGLVDVHSSASTIYDIISYVLPIAKRRSSKSVIAKLVIAASAYFIWQERNWRRFRQSKRNPT